MIPDTQLEAPALEVGRPRPSVLVRRAAFPLAGLLVVGIVLQRVGAAAFVEGLRSVDPGSVIAAVVLGAIASTACAARWRAVSRAVGVSVTLRTAVAAVYQAQLINVTIPGGVGGDVHRAALSARKSGAPGVRAVVWERAVGQVVLLALALIALLAGPFGVDRHIVISVGLAVCAAVGLLVLAVNRATGPVVRTVRRDLAAFARHPHTPLAMLTTSVLVVAAHAATFVVAARAAGVTSVEWSTLLPVAVVVLVGASIPTHIGGWGLREGAAVWAFGAAGLDGATGVRAAVAYAVITTIALLPGLLPIAFARLRRPGWGTP